MPGAMAAVARPGIMVGHQAVAEQLKGVSCLGAGEIAQERIPFAVRSKDVGPVVPAIDRMEDQVIARRSWRSCHDSQITDFTKRKR
jgi:hypothetical protein